REDLPERLELGGAVERTSPGFILPRFNQPRVAADLAQPQELGQGNHPQSRLARAGGLKGKELALGFLLERAIERSLRGIEFAPDDLLDARGQLGRDGYFGAPQDVRGRLGPQPLVDPSPFLAPRSLRDLLQV